LRKVTHYPSGEITRRSKWARKTDIETLTTRIVLAFLPYDRIIVVVYKSVVRFYASAGLYPDQGGLAIDFLTKHGPTFKKKEKI
jgi:hypothetical protein